MSDPVSDYLKTMERPVIVQFLTEAVKMEYASKEQGRPIYEEREFVRITIPGDRGTQAYEPVNDGHKERWPQLYKAFKDGRELPIEGTPLSEWPSSHINRARVEELAFFNVRTVEHAAALNDAQIQKMGPGTRELRDAAVKFLEVARTGTGPLERLVAKCDRLEIENERLTRELVESNTENERLRAQLKERATNAGA